MMLLDIPVMPYENPIALGAGVGFFFLLLAVAFILYFVLKRTVKTGLRMIIATVVLLIAVIGSIVVLVGVHYFTYQPTRHYPVRTPTPTIIGNSTR